MPVSRKGNGETETKAKIFQEHADYLKRGR